jgi:hypothetical protein
MMEQICFVIAQGDTADPITVAEKIAKDHKFSSWMVRKVREDTDGGLRSTRWAIRGWLKPNE